MSESKHQKRSSWLKWMLVDSAIPTGGFVASNGIECAYTCGLIHDELGLTVFVDQVMTNLMTQQVPYCRGIFQLLEPLAAVNNSLDQCLVQLRQLGMHLNATMVGNIASCRSSSAQGQALLQLTAKSFQSEIADSQRAQVFKGILTLVRQDVIYPHQVFIFSIVAYCLSFTEDECVEMFIYSQLRGIISAAVRLNVIGPLRSQKVLINLMHDAEKMAVKYNDVPWDQSYNEDPVMDMVQNSHTRLYSRMFNS
ncbi:hypothetical protein MIR68_004280 [Amoeboaphelidium protococcarum]|nr:hypothetical protein MIR68_004280 [Amoeboaphelidium protococcarum]